MQRATCEVARHLLLHRSRRSSAQARWGARKNWSLGGLLRFPATLLGFPKPLAAWGLTDARSAQGIPELPRCEQKRPSGLPSNAKHGRGSILMLAALAAAVAVVALAPPRLLAASTRDDDVARLRASTTIFKEIMSSPGSAIPEEILDGAQCIAIIPGVKKAAFGIGGNYGKGVAMCKNAAHTAWGPPLFVTIGGGSWGFQIGVQSTDVVMVFPNRNQLNSLLSSKFRIGAEAAAAAGPVGRHVSAATDAKLGSEILTYGRSKGAFAGISISGAVVQPDTTGNAAMYGENISDKNILDGNGARIPAAAEPLITALSRDTSTTPTGNAQARPAESQPMGNPTTQKPPQPGAATPPNPPPAATPPPTR